MNSHLQQEEQPDGTWFNQQTNVLEAPLQPRMGGAPPKTQPSPQGGPQGELFQPPQIAQQARMIDGMGNYMPGPMGMKMRTGRNYPALGALDGMPEPVKKIVAIGAIVGVAVLTVYLNKRRDAKKK
jgi:hypothetical protein